ncbi:MAG TPA: hypothetical protein VM389_05500 [Phycisphaerae bacterium]|nr:hypothetical protein [Phycisphaerae bacterium]HUU59196.1 hypothetical protein [Phycisphaerae bacterium]
MVERTEYSGTVRERNGVCERTMLVMEDQAFPVLWMKSTVTQEDTKFNSGPIVGSGGSLPGRTMVHLEATLGLAPGMPRGGAGLSAQSVRVVETPEARNDEEALANELMGVGERVVLAVEPATVRMECSPADPGVFQVVVQGPQVNGGRR